MGGRLGDGERKRAGRRTHDFTSVADMVPREWPSPAYPLPGIGTRSVQAFGAAGDGKADDTATIQRAIDECREVFFPAGTYVVSDTLRLRPDSRLFGEMWSIIKLRGNAAGYQDTASRKTLIDVPADPAATVTLCHLFFQMETPGGIWVDWRAGQKSMLIDTLCIPTSRRRSCYGGSAGRAAGSSRTRGTRESGSTGWRFSGSRDKQKHWGPQYEAKDGDLVEATIVGNVIKGYVNGVEVISATDNTYHAGNPRMGFNLGVGESNVDFGFSDYAVDSYND